MRQTNVAMTLDAEPVITEPALYSLGDVARLFEIPESRLRYWSQTGFIVPNERRNTRRFYNFRDLISIKVAKELLDAGLPLQRVRRSLDALRLQLPRIDAPLARLRIRNDNDRILVDDGSSTFDAATGQLLLDFDVHSLRDRVAEVLHLPWVGRTEDGNRETDVTAYEHFMRGQALEDKWDDVDPEGPAFAAACKAYRQALSLDDQFAAAWTNLGSLLAQAGDLDAARDHFDQALRSDPDQPEAQCNLAELALRAGDADVAIEGFRQVLNGAPDHVEAHYGLARGLIAVGGRGQALAHLERFCAAIDRMPEDQWEPELMLRRRTVRQVIETLRRELTEPR